MPKIAFLSCPMCAGPGGVRDAPSRKDSNEIRRTRVCKECGYRWVTVEVDEDALLEVFEGVNRRAEAIPEVLSE